ncbi:MAG: hypothetical protein Q7J77_08740 [Undibacterium sp.]|nr:hypothetical protein [Undibacterium sp.]
MNIRIPSAVVTPMPAAIAPLKARESAPSAVPPKNIAVPQLAEDTVALNTGVKADLTYTDPRLTQASQKPDLEALLEESNRKAQAIVDLILPLVEQQGLNLAKVVSGEQKLTADPKAIEAAKAAIAADGEFGVQKTAERILGFAKAAIGDDPAKLEKVRAAVERGFKEAADILGGTLPEISQQTLAAIQTEFDRWKTDGIPTGDTVSLAKNSG